MNQIAKLYCVIEGRNYVIHQDRTEVQKRFKQVMGPFEVDFHTELECFGFTFHDKHLAAVKEMISAKERELLGTLKNTMPGFAVVEFQLKDACENILVRKPANARVDATLKDASFIWPDVTLGVLTN